MMISEATNAEIPSSPIKDTHPGSGLASTFESRLVAASVRLIEYDLDVSVLPMYKPKPVKHKTTPGNHRSVFVDCEINSAAKRNTTTAMVAFNTQHRILKIEYNKRSTIGYQIYSVFNDFLRS